MKKISLVLLAAVSLLWVSCKNGNGNDPDTEKVKFQVKYQSTKDNWVEVKEGETITFEKPNSTDNPDEYIFDGKIFTNMDFKVVIEAVRDYQEGTTDQYCTFQCFQGNGEKTETITPEQIVTKGEDDVNGMPLQWHCTPKKAGDNILTLTIYPKNDQNNKLTFKINFKKS